MTYIGISPDAAKFAGPPGPPGEQGPPGADGAASSGLILVNSKSTNYTLVLSDQGKQILHPSADTTPRTFTIPSNATVPFPIGTQLAFVNQNGAGDLTIACNVDTMRLAATGETGSKTLGDNGIAFANKITATEWIISGYGFVELVLPDLPVLPVTSGLVGYFDSDATDGHTYVGDSVTQWTDLSGANNHISVMGEIKTGIDLINDLNTFDLQGGFFILPAAIRTLVAGNYSIYAVAKPDTKQNETLWAFRDGTLNYPRMEYDFGGDTARFQSGTGQSNIGITHTTSQHIYSGIRNGADFIGKYNATAGSTVSAQDITALQGSIGAVWNGTDGTSKFNGKICSFAIYNRAVDGTEDTNIRNYLKTRWGTP
jgi:hypothetical protein